MLSGIGRRGVVFAILSVALTAGGCSNDEPSNPAGPTSGGKGSSKSTKKAASDEADFFPLNLNDDFFMFPPGKTEPDGVAWKTQDNVIIAKGDPKGYIYTQEVYPNFTLRFDVLFPNTADEAKLNTGVLVYVGDENKIWPACLEVQGKFAELGRIKANGGVPDPQIVDNEPARQQARKPAGEWNSVEVRSKDGALTVSLNGTVVCESQAGTLNSGAIGFQAEGVEVHFRNVRIMLLPDAASPKSSTVSKK